MKQKRYCLECGKELPEGWESDLCSECMNNLASSIYWSPFMNNDDEDSMMSL